MSWGDEDTNFHVVINDEQQYSIWPDYKAIPAGWREAGKSGKKADCLAWIDEVWTDMRPLSLREAMAADAARGADGQAGPAA
ncbi:MbtH family protein [Paraburkholderia caffeinilytica]|uniref:MbtH family protein n=1 Tax=Paraburkholderia caffeinilytica TaxID=1761016 RepID=UPI0038BCD7EE